MQRLLLLSCLLLSATGLRAQCDGTNICDCVDPTTGILSGTVITGNNGGTVTIPTDCAGVPVLLGAVTIDVGTNTTLVIPDGIGIAPSASDFVLTGTGNATAELDDNGTVTTYEANGGTPTFGDLTALINQLARVLPVELLRWDALANDKGDAVILEWASAEERDNAFYFVEHSTDGVRFEEMDHIDGQVTSDRELTYEYIHHSAARGAHYYRLGQQDFDGTRQTFGVRQVTLTGTDRAAGAFPNPARAGGEVRLQLPAGAGTSPIELISPTGRRVATFPVDTERTLQRMVLPADLPAGLYLLRSGSGVQRLLVR